MDVPQICERVIGRDLRQVGEFMKQALGGGMRAYNNLIDVHQRA